MSGGSLTRRRSPRQIPPSDSDVVKRGSRDILHLAESDCAGAASAHHRESARQSVPDG
jgi:hypothetical protein